MNDKQVLNDLKAIRQIMYRTRQSASGESGWISVTGGMMWLVGFTANQFLPEEYVGWTWGVVNLCGMIAMIWAGVRLMKHGSTRTPLWRPIFFFWLVLVAFAMLLGWLFGVNGSNQIGLLALLVAALGYVQMGTIFQSHHISVTGILVAALTIGAFFLIPDQFLLAMAILGGGLLIVSGLWMVRSRT